MGLRIFAGKNGAATHPKVDIQHWNRKSKNPLAEVQFLTFPAHFFERFNRQDQKLLTQSLKFALRPASPGE